jgi:hypothetical protein
VGPNRRQLEANTSPLDHDTFAFFGGIEQMRELLPSGRSRVAFHVYNVQ